MTTALDLLAGIALLVFATRMVKTAVLRGFGGRLREALARATSGPLRAAATGLGLATALQSASATAVVAASFADRGFLALAEHRQVDGLQARHGRLEDLAAAEETKPVAEGHHRCQIQKDGVEETPTSDQRAA